MHLQAGDRVTIIDGFGVVLCQATVERFTGGATIFVREYFPNGANLHYSVPVSALENENTYSRPSVGEIVTALRTAFGLEEQIVNKGEE